MTLDPASLQVLIARLSGVATEMGAVLQRAAFSPNIKERADCSAAVFTPAGRCWPRPSTSRCTSDPCRPRWPRSSRPSPVAGDPLGPGEQAVVNDPFRGGTHLNDITVVAPCWVGGRLVGWVANRAHHADVGGAAPGSLPADATVIQQEGLRLPPIRLTADVRELILANSRTPWERAGDLDAQVGANAVGVRRLAELADAPFAEVLAHGERRCRAALARLPVGEWWAEDVMDSTGPAPDQQHPARIRCTVRTTGRGPDDRGIEFDFTGTDPQRPGNTNAVEAVTVSAVAFVLRSVVDHTLPANAGTMAPVRVVAPEGSIVERAVPGRGRRRQRGGEPAGGRRVLPGPGRGRPRPRAGRVPGHHEQRHRRRRGPGCRGPWRRPGPGRRLGVLRDGGGRPGWASATARCSRRRTPRRHERGPHRHDQHPQHAGGGPGAQLRHAGPGAAAVGRPVGPGAAPGGDGIERELELLVDTTVSLITERRVSAPWGLAGGSDGACGENWLLPGGRGRRRRSACPTR